MDSTSQLEQINASQAAHEVTANSLFDAGSVAMAYGRHAEACAGLTFGYYGVRFGGSPIGNGSNLCGASSAAYMVAHRTTGVVSFATTLTNWNDAATYGRCYKLTSGPTSITAYEDHRFGPSGILAAATQGTAAALNADPDVTLAANSDGLLATQRAVRAFVNSLLAGLSWKQAVRAASTVNGALATAFVNGSVLDSVILATGDRFLLKNQTAAAENGIYIVPASGAPTRATDADSGAKLVNASLYVSEGSQADTQWTCTNNSPITLGTTGLVFAPFAVTSSAGKYVLGASWSGGGAVIVPPADDVAVRVHTTGTISAATILTQGGIGSCVVDIWKSSFAAYPPVIAGSIVASAPPTIASSNRVAAPLTGWTVAVTAGDVLLFRLNSSTVFTAINIYLDITP